MKAPEEVVQALKDADSVLIMTHQNPDGDAIGSVSAMGLGLKQLGKNVDYYIDTNIQPSLQFLGEIKNFNKKLEEHYDVILILDCSTYDFTVHPETIPEHEKIVVIDHHKTNENYGDENFTTITAAAGELAYLTLKDLGVEMTDAIKEALFTALSSDSGSFQFANTTGQTHEIAAKLYDGENSEALAHISKRLHKLKSLKQQRMYADALDSLELFDDGKVALITLPYQNIQKHGGTTNITDDVSNIGMDTDGVIVSAFIREKEPGEFKLSFRSKAGYDIDVSELATLYDGGGHMRASGGNYSGKLEDIKAELIERLGKTVEGIEVDRELS